MRKELLSATLLLSICFGITGCGATAPVAVSASSAETTEAEIVSKEEDEADYDESQYDDSVVRSKVDEVIKNSKSIAEEIESVEKIANDLTEYHNVDLKQQEMNDLSIYEPYVWEVEMDNLLERVIEEADTSQKESIQTMQDEWKAGYDRCFNAIEYDDGSWAGMQNSILHARFFKNRCYMLAKTLSDIRGEKYELPQRYYVDNSYISDDGVLDISEGMENGSISITVVNGEVKSELLAYDPLIDDNTIVFETTFTHNGEKFNTNDGDKPIAGKITYGWDGATLTITESGDKNLPVGTTINFPTAL